MSNRLLYTLAIAISLLGLYALYSVGIQSLVVMPIRPEQPVDEDEYSEAQRPAENVRVAMTHIPEANRDWAARSKYMLRAEQAFVYTESWQQVPDNNKRIRFDKFAMVWVTIDKDGQEQAVSIVSDHALLEFASAFDERTPNPGRVVRAVLEGDVKISGPDGLSVNGHNFIFDEAELNLFTVNPVNFRFQSHSGSASRMAMKLIPAEGPPGRDRPHVYGVESIKLIANPSLPKHRFVLLEVQMPQGDEVQTVKVKCQGDMEYTVGTNTAVFTKDVIVWTGPENKIDRLDCYKLTMQFVPKKRVASDDSLVASIKSDSEKRRENQYQSVERDLEFSRLLAESQFEAAGQHGQPVKIDSKSQSSKASMGRLAFDAQTRILSMSSKEREPFVRVIQNGSELNVPTIEAQLGDAAGEQVELASFICRGAGQLKYVDQVTGKLAFVATWQKQLSKKKDAETNLDLIELEENAHFGQPEHETGLLAELIKIWLVPITISSRTVGKGEPKSSSEPEPKRLLAQNGVALRSPQLRISRTNELDIRFAENDDITPKSVTQTGRSTLQPASWTTRDSTAIGFASIPPETGGTLWPPIDIPQDDSTQRRRQPSKIVMKPIVVSADRIGVLMRRIPGKQEPEVLEVESEGKVIISQERVPGEKPTTLDGDRVHIESQRASHELIHIYGSPAKIRDPKFKIEGKEIHLDRGRNEAKVGGAGRIQLPIPEQMRLPNLEGATSRDLNVRWDESMVFDGLEAKFVGRVEAKLGRASMECEQMTLQLMEPVAFQSTSLEVNPTVRMIHCSENVRFKNSTYEKKKLIDNYRGKVGEFTWNHSTGEVIAQGPGEIQVWRRLTAEGSSFDQGDTIQANRPIPVAITEWDFTRVQFEGKLRGRVGEKSGGGSDQQSATIEDRVKVTHGPVRSSTEEVNPDDLPSKAGTIHCDKLQFVNHPVSKHNPVEYRELIGIGNAEVEGQVDGRRFTAAADEIIFDGSKGLYVLRGWGKHNASLTEIGSATVPGRTIMFNPATRALSVAGATGGQWASGR